MSEKARAHVVIHGRVQGVFFRMETQNTAKQYNVGGWVKNNPAGTVEAVFEGNKADVMTVLKWCEAGPSAAKVTDVDVEWEDYTGSFPDFTITY
jgi:acylphosphatase